MRKRKFIIEGVRREDVEKVISKLAFVNKVQFDYNPKRIEIKCYLHALDIIYIFNKLNLGYMTKLKFKLNDEKREYYFDIPY